MPVTSRYRLRSGTKRSLSVSRPSLINTIRCSVTWHSEQTNVWCPTPRRATASSGTTFVRISSAPQAVQRPADWCSRRSSRGYRKRPAGALLDSCRRRRARSVTATYGDAPIAGTTVFTGARSQQGYRINKLAIYLTRPENRAAFKADERAATTLRIRLIRRSPGA